MKDPVKVVFNPLRNAQGFLEERNAQGFLEEQYFFMKYKQIWT